MAEFTATRSGRFERHRHSNDRPGFLGFDVVGSDIAIRGLLRARREGQLRGVSYATQMANDLHALLSAASVPPPYVLVGHSLGGRIIMVFAQRFTTEVAGLVLVDPTPLGPVMLDQLEEGRLLRGALSGAMWVAAQTGATRLWQSITADRYATSDRANG